MKIAIASTGYVGLSNAVLLAQHNEVVGYKGSLTLDTSKPDGTMRKLMDVSRINTLGWKRTMQLKDGIGLSYHDMLSKI